MFPFYNTTHKFRQAYLPGRYNIEDVVQHSQWLHRDPLPLYVSGVQTVISVCELHNASRTVPYCLIVLHTQVLY